MLIAMVGLEKRFSKSLDQFPLERVCVKISEQCRIAPGVMGEKGWQGGGEHHPRVPAPSETISPPACWPLEQWGFQQQGWSPPLEGRSWSLPVPALVLRAFPTATPPAASGHQTSCPQKVLLGVSTWG